MIEIRDLLQKLDTAGFLPYTSVQRALSQTLSLVERALSDIGETRFGALSC